LTKKKSSCPQAQDYLMAHREPVKPFEGRDIDNRPTNDHSAAACGDYCQLYLKGQKEEEKRTGFKMIKTRKKRKKRWETDALPMPGSACLGCKRDWERRQPMLRAREERRVG
jgi:hypothetical protein